MQECLNNEVETAKGKQWCTHWNQLTSTDSGQRFGDGLLALPLISQVILRKSGDCSISASPSVKGRLLHLPHKVLVLDVEDTTASCGM